jgi:hypothetical protein
VNPCRRSQAALLALLVLAATVLAACSDDGSDAAGGDADRTTTAPASSTTAPPVSLDPDAAPYAETLADALASGRAGGLPLDAEAAGCLAPRWVDILGEDRLVEAGVTPEQLASGYGADTSAALGEILDDDAAEAMVDAFGVCAVDVEQVFVEGLAAGRDLPEEQQACLRDAFPEGFVQRALTIGLSEGAAAVDANVELNEVLVSAARSCVP